MLVLTAPDGPVLDGADPIRRCRACACAPVASSPSKALADSIWPATRPRRRGQPLRARKRRDEKPFAVMVRDLVQARALAVLDAPRSGAC